MKHEVYSCLKMLESLHKRIIHTYNIEGWSSTEDLELEYIRIYNLLNSYLTSEQLKFVPKIEGYQYFPREDLKKKQILRLSTTCDVAISYLHSLEMDLDKELSIKKEELRLKEKELEAREKEVDFMNKLLNKSLDAIKQFPELQRSKIVEETKKSHRQIEEHSRKV